MARQRRWRPCSIRRSKASGSCSGCSRLKTIGTSTLQSRCLAGVANGTLIFVLPGSLDAVQTAWDRLIRAQLDASHPPLQPGGAAATAACGGLSGARRVSQEFATACAAVHVTGRRE
jgi:hypothetical protein